MYNYAIHEFGILFCSIQHCRIKSNTTSFNHIFFFKQVIFHHFGLMVLHLFCPPFVCLRCRRAVCLGKQQAWATGFPCCFPSCAREDRSTLFSEWKDRCCLEWVDTPSCSDRWEWQRVCGWEEQLGDSCLSSYECLGLGSLVLTWWNALRVGKGRTRDLVLQSARYVAFPLWITGLHAKRQSWLRLTPSGPKSPRSFVKEPTATNIT